MQFISILKIFIANNRPYKVWRAECSKYKIVYNDGRSVSSQALISMEGGVPTAAKRSWVQTSSRVLIELCVVYFL